MSLIPGRGTGSLVDPWSHDTPPKKKKKECVKRLLLVRAVKLRTEFSWRAEGELLLWETNVMKCVEQEAK